MCQSTFKKIFLESEPVPKCAEIPIIEIRSVLYNFGSGIFRPKSFCKKMAIFDQKLLEN